MHGAAANSPLDARDGGQIWVNLANASPDNLVATEWREFAVYDPSGDWMTGAGAPARMSGGWRYIGARDHT